MGAMTVTAAQVETALLTAGKEAQRGVTEQGGNNRGKRVEEYLRSVGLGPGYPWCASFVNWSLEQVGVKVGPDSGATIAWRNWARQKRCLFTIADSKHGAPGLRAEEARPQRGDLFGWTNRDGTGHIGWIAEVKRDLLGLKIRTVEGNTNKEGSREGDRVLSKWRRPTSRYWFIRLVGAETR